MATRTHSVRTVIYEVVGWIGALLVLVAYWWVTKWGTSFHYHVMNLLGAAGLLANALHHRALPSTAVNVVWLFIALIGMRQARTTQQPAAG
jgi:hypothetical protein